MSHNNNRSRTYRCELVLDIEAPNKKKAAEQLLREIEEGWVMAEDITVK